MGQNLSINFANKGFAVSVFNRHEFGEESVVNKFISSRCQGKKIVGTNTIKDFINTIKAPRKIFVMVKAGTAVDEVLDQLILMLETGDIIIDGGNSHYRDSARRFLKLESLGLLFVGCGISGGSDGALNGPSIMPGGSLLAWKEIRGLLQSISAKCTDGEPCCDWIGPEGSGHFVKMAHNGIEYALMQIIAESYDIMDRMLLMSTDDICSVLSEWNEGSLNSYLLGISNDILKMKDNDGCPLVNNILDCAEQKGTGKDISISALELGVPAPTICESISARFLSGMINDRRCGSKEYSSPDKFKGDKREFIKALHEAIYCAQFIIYMEGLLIISRASAKYNWNINLVNIARIWKHGCIIQSAMMNHIASSLTKSGSDNILLGPSFIEIINRKQSSWRRAIITAIQHGIPVPSLSSSLACFDGFRSERLPANLIQAQRDYFGAHGYERIDASRGVSFHSRWDKKYNETL